MEELSIGPAEMTYERDATLQEDENEKSPELNLGPVVSHNTKRAFRVVSEPAVDQ
jgi:hypothetical protein